MTMLNEIRQERDNFREVTTRYHAVVIEKDLAMNDLYQAHRMTEEANQLARDFQKDMTSLQRKVNGLEIQSMKDSRLSPIEEERTLRRSKEKSVKSSRIEQKFKANSDHYLTEDSKITYVVSQLGGKAAQHTMHRRLRNSTNPYQSFTEIMDELADIYENSDRRSNALRDIHALQQRTRPFIDFYLNFIRLATVLNLDETVMIEYYLPNKLRSNLRESWDTVGGFTTLKAVKEYLRKLNNLYRARYKDIESTKATVKSTIIRTTANARLISVTGVITTTPLSVKTDLKPREPMCYNCGKKGYYRSIYIITTQTEAGKKAFEEVRLHAMEIDEEFEIDNVDTTGSDGSSSDSGNE
ncbi:hypothetical protein HO173_001724 [Letharia columbiana]|uniref:Retrotransposon gag domain-containing protein n=1 Tax=Letharia columbiana TaxID=112416 RepID=A0A8H6G3W8_9LECA|nr:uncharacterized protein HO173_001724 [Letharia columbiana]KAF6240114.1 hypothetical protein HO173_001724 [Letharia columbiana]